MNRGLGVVNLRVEVEVLERVDGMFARVFECHEIVWGLSKRRGVYISSLGRYVYHIFKGYTHHQSEKI